VSALLSRSWSSSCKLYICIKSKAVCSSCFSYSADIAALITVILKLCVSVYVGLAVAIYAKIVVYLNLLVVINIDAIWVALGL
jgi:hypothetical protein